MHGCPKVTFQAWSSSDGSVKSNAMALLLTNGTIQVNFVEISTKLIVHAPFDVEKAIVLLIDRTRALQTFEMKDIAMFPPSEMDKLNSVHQIFHAIHPELACNIDPARNDLHTGCPISNMGTPVYGSVLCKLCSNNSTHV